MIVEDPEFASAYNLLALVIMYQAGPPEEVLRLSEKAYELSENTPTRERFFIQGSYHEIREEWEDAYHSFRALVRLHPDHSSGVLKLVIHLHTRGNYSQGNSNAVFNDHPPPKHQPSDAIRGAPAVSLKNS